MNKNLKRCISKISISGHSLAFFIMLFFFGMKFNAEAQQLLQNEDDLNRIFSSRNYRDIYTKILSKIDNEKDLLNLRRINKNSNDIVLEFINRNFIGEMYNLGILNKNESENENENENENVLINKFKRIILEESNREIDKNLILEKKINERLEKLADIFNKPPLVISLNSKFNYLKSLISIKKYLRYLYGHYLEKDVLDKLIKNKFYNLQLGRPNLEPLVLSLSRLANFNKLSKQDVDEIFKNANLECTDCDGNTAIHYAISSDNVKYFEECLNARVNIDRSNFAKVTPLMKAVKEINLKYVEKLLMLGANIEESDLNGETALFYLKKIENTIENTKKAGKIFNMLLKYNANLFHRNKAGKTLYDIANRTLYDIGNVEENGKLKELIKVYLEL